jgi:hypothetical protein
MPLDCPSAFLISHNRSLISMTWTNIFAVPSIPRIESCIWKIEPLDSYIFSEAIPNPAHAQSLPIVIRYVLYMNVEL